jgi:hypothetical protein
MARPGSEVSKTMSQFLPVSTKTREECNEHYERVHTRWARHLLRGKEQVVSYHVARATAEHDLLGTWEASPTAFRFITLRFRAGRGLEATEQESELISRDHLRFLRELRGFDVEEAVLVDELRGQTSLVKYVFEFDREPSLSPEYAGTMLAEVGRGLSALAPSCFGMRRLVMNHVRHEFAAEPIEEPGQRPASTPLASTTRVGMLEMYADQAEWAEEWLARADVLSLLRDAFTEVRGSRVVESCGLDRR